MLVVFSGQAMAAESTSSCDMDMHDMAMMDHGNMNMSHHDMDTQKMDCCDETCIMDCSFSMTNALIENSRFEVLPVSSTLFSSHQDGTTILSLKGLYRPPISA